MQTMRRKFFRTADKIITIGKSLKNSFCAIVPGIEEKIEVITNGYDEDDFTIFSGHVTSGSLYNILYRDSLRFLSGFRLYGCC